MKLEKKEYSRAYAKVDLNAIRHNINEIKNYIQSETKIMAVIKADGYGHGAIQVAEALGNQVDAYGVAIIEEAIELRKAGLDKPILILGFTDEAWFEEIVEYKIAQTIYEYDMAVRLSDVAVSHGTKVPIHIKVDTGMNRIGFVPNKESLATVEKISKLPGLFLEGVFTHFAKADEENAMPILEPFSKYMNFIKELEQFGIHIPIKHASNSAAIINFPDANLNMVRSGISTYGIYPSNLVSRENIKLKPAMELKARISYIKEVEEGEAISYGGTFVATRRTRVATIPIGYADGMKRDLSNKGNVLVCGELAPVIGRICMDQFMIDVTDIEQVKEGCEVTIFGKDGENSISVEAVSERAHSFSYEFLCSISKRIPRKYEN